MHVVISKYILQYLDLKNSDMNTAKHPGYEPQARTQEEVKPHPYHPYKKGKSRYFSSTFLISANLINDLQLVKVLISNTILLKDQRTESPDNSSFYRSVDVTDSQP